MKESRKYIYLIITGILAMVYFGVLDCWKYILEGELFGKTDTVGMILGKVLGLYAVLVLAFVETSILIQLYYRKKYSMFERKCLDNNMKIQISLLVFYYISSFIFSRMVPIKTLATYLVWLPIFMAVRLAKMSRTVWKKEDTILFMDVNGEVFEIDEISVGEDTLELICKSGDKKSIKKTKKIAGLYG